jgi:hypothetical protein
MLLLSVVTQSEPESTAADKAAPRAVPTWHCRHGAHVVPTAAAPPARRRHSRHGNRRASAFADAVAGSVPRGAHLACGCIDVSCGGSYKVKI